MVQDGPVQADMVMEDKRRADVETNAKLEELFLAAAACLSLRQCKIPKENYENYSATRGFPMISQFSITSLSGYNYSYMMMIYATTRTDLMI